VTFEKPKFLKTPKKDSCNIFGTFCKGHSKMIRTVPGTLFDHFWKMSR
jgi:hypothetical protein